MTTKPIICLCIRLFCALELAFQHVIDPLLFDLLLISVYVEQDNAVQKHADIWRVSLRLISLTTSRPPKVARLFRDGGWGGRGLLYKPTQVGTTND